MINVEGNYTPYLFSYQGGNIVRPYAPTGAGRLDDDVATLSEPNTARYTLLA